MIGTAAYRLHCRHYDKPIVIAGFEPLDILQSLWMVLRQLAEGRCEVENQYPRVRTRSPVTDRGWRRSPAYSSCASSTGEGIGAWYDW